jgi:prepilin-type N-terminal cleavage/methylation domain-containing protein
MKEYKMKKRQFPRGMTVIEIIAVLFIASILFALAAPFVSRVTRAFKRHSATRVIASMLRNTRALAVSSSATYSLRYDSANSLLYIADGNGDRTGKNYSIYITVAMMNGTPTLDPGLTRIDFFRDGSCALVPPGGSVVIRCAPDVRLDRISITTATGQIKIEKNL